jgi:uncharacterized protein (DUF488 family)
MKNLYKRHKMLLALLSTFGGELGAIEFMKYLLLMNTGKADAMYSFVPYRFGGFSYQAYADKRTLIRKGLLEDSEGWELTASGKKATSFFDSSAFCDSKALFQKYKGYSSNEVVRETYRLYPFYALNSEIASTVLSEPELALVHKMRPSVSGAAIISAGYEGKSLDKYLLALFQSGVSVLVDVRKNAFSMKYGFSKKTLSSACANLGIEYMHVPSLGIESASRKNLSSQAEYDALFDEYKNTVLKLRTEELDSLAEMVNNGSRIALICYEANPAQCHRTLVADALSKLTGIGVQKL